MEGLIEQEQRRRMSNTEADKIASSGSRKIFSSNSEKKLASCFA